MTDDQTPDDEPTSEMARAFKEVQPDPTAFRQRLAKNRSATPERVLTPRQTAAIARLISAMENDQETD